MGILKSLDGLYKDYEESLQKEQTMETKMEEEIRQSEETIRKKYKQDISSLRDDSQKKKEEIDETTKKIVALSTFNIRTLGSVLAELISIIEAEDYTYQEAAHDTYTFETTAFGSESFKAQTKVQMVAKKTSTSSYYHDLSNHDNEVERLQREGKIVVLSEQSGMKKELSFYLLKGGNLKAQINLSKFPYVKEFIDYVIEYKYQNKKDDLNQEELMMLMRRFALTKRELIEENYKRRSNEQAELLKERFRQEQEKLRDEQALAELELLLQNGVQPSETDSLEDRIASDEANDNKLRDEMQSLAITYEGIKHPATIKISEKVFSNESMLIGKAALRAQIKDYYDDSNDDSHFHGFCDIDIEDDGLVGYLDVSNSSIDLIKELAEITKKYRIDIINGKYLRLTYLPNEGQYHHKPTNIYSWILSGKAEDDEPKYKKEWSFEQEVEKMKEILKEIELLSRLNERQIEIYKQKRKQAQKG